MQTEAAEQRDRGTERHGMAKPVSMFRVARRLVSAFGHLLILPATTTNPTFHLSLQKLSKVNRELDAAASIGDHAKEIISMHLTLRIAQNVRLLHDFALCFLRVIEV